MDDGLELEHCVVWKIFFRVTRMEDRLEILRSDDIPQNLDMEGDQFSSFVGFCFALNLIVGVGVLGLPYALMRAGYAAGIFLMVCVTIMSSLSVMWILESLCRGKALANKQGTDELASGNVPRYGLSSGRKLEMVDLVEMFLGKRWKIAYKIVISIFVFGLLISYSAVFASSMSSRIPLGFLGFNDGKTCNIETDTTGECVSLYRFYLFLFGCLVVPLSCMDLKDQKWFQVLLSLFRFVMITAILGTSAKAYSDNGGAIYPKAEASVTGLIRFIPIATYAQLFHHSIPSIAQSLRFERKAPKTFFSALVGTFLMYTTVGVVVSSYFGSSVAESCVLNWAGSNSPGPVFISSMIVIFPAFDVVSAFPLNAIALSSNLHSTSESSNISRIRTIIRLVVSISPILVALILHNLIEILEWCGLMGGFIGFIFPGIVNLYSKRRCRIEFDDVQEIPLGDISKGNSTTEFSPMEFDDKIERVDNNDEIIVNRTKTPFTSILSHPCIIYTSIFLSSAVILTDFITLLLPKPK